MLEELSKLRANLDKYHWAIEAGDPQWRKEQDKHDYYNAKLLIFKKYLTDNRNFYYGVISL